MIEIVSNERCTGCNICVAVCPVNVFDAVTDGPPMIARQGDCQTCFMCELYCPVDALYVAPDAERPTAVDEEAIEQADLFGSYRRTIGWTQAPRDRRAWDQSYRLRDPH